MVYARITVAEPTEYSTRRDWNRPLYGTGDHGTAQEQMNKTDTESFLPVLVSIANV